MMCQLTLILLTEWYYSQELYSSFFNAVLIYGTILHQLDDTAAQYLTDQRSIDISIFIDRYVPLLKLNAEKDAWGHFLIITFEAEGIISVHWCRFGLFFCKMLNVLLP